MKRFKKEVQNVTKFWAFFVFGMKKGVHVKKRAIHVTFGVLGSTGCIMKNMRK